MPQDRMESAGNTQTNSPDTYRAPDFETTLSRAASVTQKVRVVHGANEQYFDNLEGKTVGSIKKSLREVFNIPGDASALIEGKEVQDDFVLEGGMNLEFVKEAGVKGHDLSFKQQVALALLQNLEWLPKFDDMEAAADYVSESLPEDTRGAIALQQKVMGVLVAETAEQIVNIVGE